MPLDYWNAIHSRFCQVQTASKSAEDANCEHVASNTTLNDEDFAQIVGYMVSTGHRHTTLARYSFSKNGNLTEDQRLLQLIGSPTMKVRLVELYDSAKYAVVHLDQTGTSLKHTFQIENVGKIISQLQMHQIAIRSHLQRKLPST